MLKKVLPVIANILLLLLPFSPILGNYAPFMGGNFFATYLPAWVIFSILLLLLAAYIRSNNNSTTKAPPKLIGAAWLFFLLAILCAAPLHLGPPAMGELLLNTTTLERFRYAMLLLAVVTFLVAAMLAVFTIWGKLKIPGKAIVMPLLAGVFISLWDSYDSYLFGTKTLDWVNSGKNANDFASHYNFHETWRAAGRILIYVNTAWLVLILWKQAAIKKWVAILLNIFCVLGTCFCVTYLIKAAAFYFPFMVPAIVLAPAYWLGVALLNNSTRDTSPAN